MWVVVGRDLGSRWSVVGTCVWFFLVCGFEDDYDFDDFDEGGERW